MYFLLQEMDVFYEIIVRPDSIVFYQSLCVKKEEDNLYNLVHDSKILLICHVSYSNILNRNLTPTPIVCRIGSKTNNFAFSSTYYKKRNPRKDK